MQIKRVDRQGWELCGNPKVNAKRGIMMCNVKEWMDKGGHCDVQIKMWI